MLILGHRGCGCTDSDHARHREGQRPAENSPEAFRKALATGADGIELDVLWTQDKKIVVCHSDLLASHTFHPKLDGRISETRWVALKGIQAGRNGDGYIPLLSDALAIASGKTVNIEIKDTKGTQAPDPPGS